MGVVKVGGMVEKICNYFMGRLHRGQEANVLYKTMRLQNDKPKFMTDRLRRRIGQIISIYRRLNVEEDFRPQYNKLARTVKRLTRKAKNNYDIKVVSETKMDPKGLFRYVRRKVRKNWLIKSSQWRDGWYWKRD